jgi:hypothetical protein
MPEVGVAEVQAMGHAHRAEVEAVIHTPALMGREGVSWATVVLRLPDIKPAPEGLIQLFHRPPVRCAPADKILADRLRDRDS